MASITPIGLQLSGKDVVVVGGGPVAARRARLLVRAGARIKVIAPMLCADMTELLASVDFAHRTTGTPNAIWVARNFEHGDLDGAWLIATATGNDHVDNEVAQWAEEHRVFCFKGGDPEGASAWAPALLDHGDATIAVVSNRASNPKPRRTVSLRDKIASFLRASSITPAVQATFSKPHGPVPGTFDEGQKNVHGVGSVTLVGGGPGAVELLTLAAKQAVENAEVLVIDKLAPRGVLDWVGPSVEIIDVGKSGGNHPVSQEEINEILVDRALAGKQVVRLKGGDPYVFGRGGEELDVCRARGIDVSVIPGISSAISVPSAAGIPVTHRGVSRGFTVLTAHSELGAAPLAQNHTLVLLMGVAQLETIAQKLIEQGNAPSTPCAIVEDGYGPRQRTTVATLDTLAQKAREIGVRPPAVTVVGDVVLRADVLTNQLEQWVSHSQR